jgi:hypothetical protein
MFAKSYKVSLKTTLTDNLFQQGSFYKQINPQLVLIIEVVFYISKNGILKCNVSGFFLINFHHSELRNFFD